MLKPGGKVHFWTDVEAYFEEAIDSLRELSGLDGPKPVEEYEAEHDMDYRTHFERRMRKNDHDVFRCQFEKPNLAATWPQKHTRLFLETPHIRNRAPDRSWQRHF